MHVPKWRIGTQALSIALLIVACSASEDRIATTPIPIESTTTPTQSSTPTESPVPSTATLPPPTSTPLPPRIQWPESGAYVGLAPENNNPTLASISAWERRLGKELGFVAYWYDPCQIQSGRITCTDYFSARMQPFAKQGKAIIVVWGADGGWNADTQQTDPAIMPFSEIIEGEYDGPILTFARLIKNLDVPVIMRFGSEMNISNHANSGLNLFGSEGNLAWNRTENLRTHYGDPDLVDGVERYCDTYAHVRNLFTQAMAENVVWAFSPNYVTFDSPTWNTLEAYWCSGWDVLAPSVYPYLPNFWHDFDYQYNLLIRPFWQNHQVPVILGEWSAPESSRKAQYYADTLEAIRQYPEIKGIVIFATEAYDCCALRYFRPNSSESALQAISAALASEYYIDGMNTQ